MSSVDEIMADEMTLETAALEPLHGEGGRTNASNQTQCCRGVSLFILDATALLTVITTATVFFWRGTWYIMDNIVNPYNYEASGWLSFVFGFLTIIVMHMWQGTFKRLITRKKNAILWHILSRLHTYILSFGCVNHWRGVWHVWDNYTGSGFISSLVSIFLSLAILWLFRASRNALRPPFYLLLDCEHKFTVLTRYRTNISNDVYLYLLDLLFTVIIIGSAIVSYWRGVWTCLDNVLFPKNTELSGWISLGIGYGIIVVCYLLQYCAAEVSRRLRKYPRIVFEDLYLLILSFATVNVWRGIWYLSDIYIIPDKPLISGVVSHCIGLVIVFTMGTGRSLLTTGCAIDGELGDGRGVLFSHYITRQGNQIRNPHKVSVPVSMDTADSSENPETDEDYQDNEMGYEDDVEIRSSGRLGKRRSSTWWLNHFKLWYL